MDMDIIGSIEVYKCIFDVEFIIFSPVICKMYKIMMGFYTYTFLRTYFLFALV